VNVAALLEDVAAEIFFVDALHDDYFRAGLRVVESRAHRFVPPAEGFEAGGFAFALDDVVRVIDDDAVAPFAGGPSADAGGDARAGFVVFEAVLGVLVGAELEAVAPVMLIPLRLY
jgi:hypothetical protein